MSIGTRGDIEPMLALGHILAKRDWKIVCVFPEQFRAQIQEEGFEFYGFTKEWLRSLAFTKHGRSYSGGGHNLIVKIQLIIHHQRAIRRMDDEVLGMQKSLLEGHQPDLVVFHNNCIVRIVWGLLSPEKAVLVCTFPGMLHPIPHHSIISIGGGSNYGRTINRLSYFITNITLSIIYFFTLRKYPINGRHKKLSAWSIYQFRMKKMKALYPLSPTLFPKPKNWHRNIHVTGYFERPQTDQWSPLLSSTNFSRLMTRSYLYPLAASSIRIRKNILIPS